MHALNACTRVTHPKFHSHAQHVCTPSRTSSASAHHPHTHIISAHAHHPHTHTHKTTKGGGRRTPSERELAVRERRSSWSTSALSPPPFARRRSLLLLPLRRSRFDADVQGWRSVGHGRSRNPPCKGISSRVAESRRERRRERRKRSGKRRKRSGKRRRRERRWRKRWQIRRHEGR